MKLKIKASWIGLFIIAMMLFSTFAYAVIQSLYPKQRTKLPESNIIDYELDQNLQTGLLQYGATIIKFDYNLGCQNCVSQKSTLEFYANEYKQQIFLEELKDESLNQSKITVESAYGSDELVSANETMILNSLCKLLVSPPATCALTT